VQGLKVRAKKGCALGDIVLCISLFGLSHICCGYGVITDAGVVGTVVLVCVAAVVFVAGAVVFVAPGVVLVAGVDEPDTLITTVMDLPKYCPLSLRILHQPV
jgi:hypothetical protein